MFALLLALASTVAAPPPLLQAWSDTGLVSVDDDWSRVPGVVGYRGDGLVDAPGADPRGVVADGSRTPVDVTANRPDPRAVGLAAGVTEFELADPVVAIQGSATASAPHLVLSLDTRGQADVSVRLVLRDIDATGADAISPVALQYRVGASGNFTAAPGGYVADATTGPSAAALVTPVRTTLPAAANDKPLVQLRVITTNAAGQDEWIGIDDIEVTAVAAAPPPPPPASCPPPPRPRELPPLELTDLTLRPHAFAPTRRGGAIIKRGGASLRFRLSRAAVVRFEAVPARSGPDDFAPKPGAASRPRATASRPRTTTGGSFSVRGKRGLNRLRFSGRIKARPLAPGDYFLTAAATDRAKRRSSPTTVPFTITDKTD
jgi:hypothetical protein